MFPNWEIIVLIPGRELQELRMKVIGLGKISDFAIRHGDVLSQCEAWIKEAENAKWQSPQEVKNRYPSASILADNRVIFNLKGNHYRLDTKITYNTQIVLIIRIGTHAEYDKWKF